MNSLVVFLKKQPNYIYWLLFSFSLILAAILFKGLFGFVALLSIFILQANSLNLLIQRLKFPDLGARKYLLLTAYHIISLSAIYYSLGLSKINLLFWVILNLLLGIIITIHFSQPTNPLPLFILTIKKYFKDLLSSKIEIIIFLLFIYLFSYFLSSPILDGSPTPWINFNLPIFIIFFLLSFLIIHNSLKKENPIILWLYLFLIIGLVALRYQLSFGFDTLLHQASLEYIAQHSQISPLTPFYIGQYVLEILINFFTRWSFLTIERWFMPLSATIILLIIGNYFIQELKLKTNKIIIPISALFILPAIFYSSSPYAFSLIWAIVAIIEIFIFLENNNRLNFFMALAAVTASLFIHPFIGLNVLIWIIAAWKYKKSPSKKLLFLTFIIASMAVAFSFAVYNWLRGDVLTLADPIFFIDKFLNLINDPIWYDKSLLTFWPWLVYFFEKAQTYLIVIIIIITYFSSQNFRSSKSYLLLISFSSVISAWLFSSALEISEFTYGDQVNYSYRLLQAAKWLLWPLIIIAFAWLFNRLKQNLGSPVNRKNLFIRFSAIILLALSSTFWWYITYPRNDDISRINVNNIREIDYEAIDLVYNLEKGKDNYLVLANQLFGAAAIQKYGFGPYYETPWGNLFYYSIPMGSELNKRYETIMTNDEFDYDLIKDIMDKSKINKLYFIATDYWPLSKNSEKEIAKKAKNSWNLDDQIQIYLFTK